MSANQLFVMRKKFAFLEPHMVCKQPAKFGQCGGIATNDARRQRP